jgi:hypothetical protein
VEPSAEVGLVSVGAPGLPELGVPPSSLIAAQGQVVEHARAVADVHVSMFLETGGRSLLEAASPGREVPGEELERIRGLVDRLQPAAAQALLAGFRTEMAARVQAALTEALAGPPAPRDR